MKSSYWEKEYNSLLVYILLGSKCWIEILCFFKSSVFFVPDISPFTTTVCLLRNCTNSLKYDLIVCYPHFQEWVTDIPFVISPRITFEVSVRLLGGLMALGYTIATILKRNSHVFSDDKVCVKIDWLEQLNRQYLQVLLRIWNLLLSGY